MIELHVFLEKFKYSTFRSHKQIIGRALRLNRVVPVDLIRLDNV